MQFKEKGYIFRHNVHFKLATSLICVKRASRYRSELGIDDTLTAYLILIAGHISSISILGIEVLVSKFSKKMRL